MELRHLRYFEAVARLGNVTRAAAALHIAQPSLSKQIQALEAELGVQLFNRVGRGIEIADAGHVLLPYARRILQDVAAAEAALLARRDLRTGRVSLGTTPTVGTHLLPDALAAFNGIYSGIELELHETGATELHALLSDGTVDLAVVAGRGGDVRWIELFTEDLVIAVARDHRLAQHEHVSVAELAGENWIVFPPGYELRTQTLWLWQAANIAPQVVLDGGEMHTVLQLAAVGLGVAVVPQMALQGGANLVGLRLSDVQLRRTLGLIWHPERALTPAAHTLQLFLVERLRRVTTQAARLSDAGESGIMEGGGD